MRRLLLFLLMSLGTVSAALASDSIPTVDYGPEGDRYLTFGQHCDYLLETDEPYSIERIMGDSSLKFRSGVEEFSAFNLPYTVWQRIRLRNVSEQDVHDLLCLHSYSDTSWVYVVDEGRIVEERMTGGNLRPSEKISVATGSMVPFGIPAGEERTYYIRTRFSRCATCLNSLASAPYLYPLETYLRQRSNREKWSHFYAGALLFGCLASLVMLWVFREMTFLYFGGLTFFMAVYALGAKHQLNTLLDLSFHYFSDLADAALVGLLICLYLFIFHYLGLAHRRWRGKMAYQALTGFLLGGIIVKFVFNLALHNHLNLLLLFWIMVTITIIGVQAWRGSTAARTVLVSILALVVGGSWFVLGALRVIAPNTLDFHFFQGGTLVFCGILFYGLFGKVNKLRSDRREAEEFARLQSRFFANISHEFRTPLTLMLAPLQRASELSQDDRQRELIDLAHDNAERQLDLIGQLLDLSRAESGQLNLRAAEADLAFFLRGAVNSYSSLAEQREIDLHLDMPPEAVPLWYDREKMEQIVYNLLTNAFKFTPAGGDISVRLQTTTERATVTIADTGIGIPAERLPFIFDRFDRGEVAGQPQYEGFGIGLSLVRELVDLHGGDIDITSEEGVGTTVRLTFLRGKAHLSAEQLEQENETAAAAASTPTLPAGLVQEPVLPSNGATATERERILLIEDHPDVRAFVRKELEEDYEILEAEDGETGIRLAVRETPDLIISDVMMPGMDGYEVCRTLKGDVRTSHVPVILLTARAARDEKLTGLETGADDYLTKPFDVRELALRISNLLRQRERLRQRFATEISLQPAEIATNSMDQEFLSRVLETVEAHLGDSSFGVPDLAAAANMSTSNLTRKVKALLGKTANQFIRDVRLQRAADLLRARSGSVSEIAFQTGFGSTAYFIRLFKEKFGETPGAYAKQE